MMKRYMTIAVLALAAGACSGGEPKAERDTHAVAQQPATATPGEVTPGPGGKVIEIAMVTDDKGNYFEPAKVEAHAGDVLRFTLRSGVHNVNFLPDSNPGKSNLPPASQMLQLPGQTWDIAVPTAAGDYFFQCDPHALLGMVGRLEVEDDED